MSRLVRTLLIVGVLAIVFAPGAIGHAVAETPTTLAAAVLAPTSGESATVAVTEPGSHRVPPLQLLVALTVTLFAMQLGWRRRPTEVVSPLHVSAGDPSRARRRGPPLPIV